MELTVIKSAEPQIHETAVVDPTAKLHKNVIIEPYAVIGPNCEIGEGSIIGFPCGHFEKRTHGEKQSCVSERRHRRRSAGFEICRRIQYGRHRQ